MQRTEKQTLGRKSKNRINLPLRLHSNQTSSKRGKIPKPAAPVPTTPLGSVFNISETWPRRIQEPAEPTREKPWTLATPSAHPYLHLRADPQRRNLPGARKESPDCAREEFMEVSQSAELGEEQGTDNLWGAGSTERERKVGLPHGRRRFAGRKRRSLVTTRGQNSGAEESIEYSHLVGGGSIWGSHLVCISFWKESGMFLSAMAAHVPPLNVTGRSRVGRLGGRMRFLSPWEIDPSPPSGLRGVRSSALKSATQVGELTTRALR